jgi:hypothetical protein
LTDRVPSHRKKALADYLTRKFWTYVHNNQLNIANNNTGSGGDSGWAGAKGGDINIDKPGQQVLERTSVVITVNYVEARFTLGLPARGNETA